MYDDFFQLEKEHWWFVGRRKIVFRLIEKYIKGPCAILDAGCGTGYTALELSKYGEVSGFDASEAAVEYTKKRGVELVKQGLITAIPYASEHFDIVTALDVLEHIDEDQLSILELQRILRPGGIMVLTVPAFQFLWSPHDEMSVHKRRYSRNDLREKIERSGLKVLKLSYFNFFLFAPTYFVRLIRKAVPAKSEEAKSDFTIFNRGLTNTVLQNILSAESRLIGRFDFPFGVSLVCIAQRPI